MTSLFSTTTTHKPDMQLKAVNNRIEETLGIVLALVLSFLPALFLRWEWSSVPTRAIKHLNSDEVWLHTASLAAASLRKASNFSAWVSLNAQSICNYLESLLQHGSRTSSLDRLFSEALARGHLAGLPRGLCWAFAVEPSNDSQKDFTVRLCRGAGLESQLRHLFTELARGVVQSTTKGASELLDRNLSRRVQGIFGDLVFPELFGCDYQGVPFAVIFRGKPYYFTWRVVRDPALRQMKTDISRQRAFSNGKRIASSNLNPDGLHQKVIKSPQSRQTGLSTINSKDNTKLPASSSVRGVIFILIPFPANPANTTIKLCLRNWNLIRQQKQVWPVFVPLPSKDTNSSDKRIYIHPYINCPEVKKHAVRLARSMTILRPMPNEKPMGQTKLPGKAVGQVLDWGDYRALISPLSDSMPYAALLISLREPKMPNSLLRISKSWIVLAGAFWLFLLIIRFMNGEWVIIPFQTSLVLWILGLLVLPLVLSWKSGYDYVADLAGNLAETQRRQMVRLVSEIEVGYSKLRQTQRQACRDLGKLPNLEKRLYKIQTEGVEEGPLLSEMFHHLKMHGLDPTAIYVFGHGKWYLATFSQELGESTRFSFPMMLDSLVTKFLDPPNQKSLIAANIIAQMQALHARRPELKRMIRPSLPLMSGITFNEDIQILSRHGNDVQEVYVGHRYFNLFVNFIPNQLKPHYMLLILWNPQISGKEFLREAVPSTWLAYLRENGSGLDLGAYQIIGNQCHEVITSGDKKGLIEWAQNCEQRAIFSTANDAEILATPIKGLPSFILVARLSLVPLLEIVAREKILWILIMFSLLGLAALAALGLSRWLAGPVLRMTTALQRVISGDLSVQIIENRSDELGQATATLNTMIRWLIERERLLPFVSAKALEAACAGNLFTAGAGSVQKVAVLVSDIRSFTSLTEMNPPTILFETLNEHLGAMTAVVQAHGGQIDRFVGDAIWAIFFSSEGQTPAQAAVAAARAMMIRHAALNRLREAAGKFTFSIGIGIEIGEVVAGILGDPNSRLDFTVIGEAVGDAAKCEAASKIGTRTKIVASARVVETLPEVQQKAWYRLPLPDELFELQDDEVDVNQGQTIILQHKTLSTRIDSAPGAIS